MADPSIKRLICLVTCLSYLWPSGAVSVTSLHHVSCDWRSTIILWRLPSQLAARLSDVINKHILWWAWGIWIRKLEQCELMGMAMKCSKKRGWIQSNYLWSIITRFITKSHLYSAQHLSVQLSKQRQTSLELLCLKSLFRRHIRAHSFEALYTILY